ncbi:MAG TPA: adenosylcobinamide-GDP ribazoletransferase [Rhizorhapis sp.]
MRRLVLALQFLTCLPLPQVRADESDFAASMRWFPAAGLAVGAVVAGAAWVGTLFDPWIAALFALAAWVGITGALHLDGLSDLADARGAAHGDRDKLLTVLADPHVGSFGVTVIVLQLLAKAVLLHATVQVSLPALIFIPFAARIGPLAWSRWLPPLHAGLGARFASSVRRVDLAIWLFILLGACWFVPALLSAPLLICGWFWWLRRAVGGVSGDCHGAGIELVETALLFTFLIAGKLP